MKTPAGEKANSPEDSMIVIQTSKKDGLQTRSLRGTKHNPKKHKNTKKYHIEQEVNRKVDEDNSSYRNLGENIVNKTNEKRINLDNCMQRRILANARERSRVHKLGKAFDNLRRVIPSYSKDQKLSKLSILKIAISYISGLASLLESDESEAASQRFAESVEECTYALQAEFGRSKMPKRLRLPLKNTMSS